MLSLITIIILIIDFVISIWNAYASGFNIGLLQKKKIDAGKFSRISSYAGLGLSFVGMAYVLIIVISLAGNSLGYVDVGTVNFALAFDFLVFGILIIGLGLLVTIQSVIIAAQRKSIGSVLVAVFNVFAEVWDIASYVSGFKESVNMLKGENKDEQANAAIIVVVAVLIAFFIVHAAYKHGFSKGQNA